MEGGAIVSYTIYVCPECGSSSLASPGCTHLVGVAEVFGDHVPKERTVPRDAVEVFSEAEVRDRLKGPEANLDKALEMLTKRRLAIVEYCEQLREFDAWLSFRGEFAEVLTAFRSAFRTDTSVAGIDREPAAAIGEILSDQANALVREGDL
jgi:hypothetical protein